MLKKTPDAFLPLKSNWFHILLCLVEGEQHGYGIMQNVLARSEGKVRLWPATLYGSLKRLIKAGLIVESGDRPAPEFDDARRRYYKLTTLGRRVLDLESQRVVVTLRDVHGYGSEEVCEVLEISPGNQRVLLHRARARIRNRLERHFDG